MSPVQSNLAIAKFNMFGAEIGQARHSTPKKNSA